MKKYYKVYKIAGELNLASDTILGFLENDLKLDVSKKGNTRLSEEQYVEVLKKFDRLAYNDYVKSDNDSSQKNKTVPSERKMDIKSRAQELEEILKAEEEKNNKISQQSEDTSEKRKRRSSRRIKHSEEKIEELAEQPVTNETEEKIEEDKKKIETPVKSEKKIDKPVESKKIVEEKDKKSQEKNNNIKKDKEESSDKKSDKKKDKKKKGKKEDEVVIVDDDNKEKKKSEKSTVKLKHLKRKKVKTVGDVDPDTSNVKPKKKKKKKIDKAVVQDSVKETLKKLSDQPKSFKKKKKKKTAEDGQEVEIEVNVVKATEFISTSELAAKMEVDPAEIIAKCFAMGMMVTINQRLDKEQIELITAEFDFDVEFESEYTEEEIEKVEQEEDKEEDLRPRPPIVTIMGHVDHGKTSLLDYIRESKVVAGESGGITQHIGAYEVEYEGKSITFLDTPGHEAFTAMRARGAKVTDIVIIVVAADDSVMPQTIEAIDHSKAAGVPIIIAINKMDKPNADSQRIKADLSGHGILVEEFGGKIQSVEISAKTGMGIDDLLQGVLLESEMLELQANPFAKPKATVIEAKLDKGLGPVSTVIVERGTLKIGDIFVCGQFSGRVRNLINERKQRVEEVKPGLPIIVLGSEGVPKAGDSLIVFDSEKEAREIANKRQQLNRVHAQHKIKIMSLDQISQQIKLGQVRELNVIIKGDVDGSVEAICDSIMKLSTEEVAVKVVLKGVGTITESDVLLAEASNAVIMGFRVRPNLKARELAEKSSVEIRQYSIIYDLIEEVKNALEGLLQPDIKEEVVGTAEIRAVFKVPKIGNIAGCYVMSGKFTRDVSVRLIREDVEIYDGKLSSLKRLKDDVKEVGHGYECGMGVANYNDIKEGDIIEAYVKKEVKRKLK